MQFINWACWQLGHSQSDDSFLWQDGQVTWLQQSLVKSVYCMFSVLWACGCTVDTGVIWISVCLCVACCVCVHRLLFIHFCRRLLERITSFKEYEIQHLLKSDTPWHCFEAMKVRLERHGSAFLSTESWVYVIGLRPVKFQLKRCAPEWETKLPLKAFECIFSSTRKASFNGFMSLGIMLSDFVYIHFYWYAETVCRTSAILQLSLYITLLSL